MSGVFGDRISKKKFILSIDLLRFIITFVWGVSLFYHSFNIVEVYIYTFVLSLIDAVFNPIYNAILPEVANTDNLSRLVSINQMVFKIASILAPTFAGIAIIKLQFNQFIILDSITFLIAALFTLPIKYENKNQTIQKRPAHLII
ncbi:MFS transporter [Heyndrickxia coagulans]|uniref:MFS transporter n=1 Tax=Heyndrickxia coagulans TaxID=1398 RepID=UPI003461B38D